MLKKSSSVDLEIEANQSKTVLYNKPTMKFDEAFQLATAVSESDNHILYKCTKKLRRDIFNPENQVLGNHCLLRIS